jgi:hypothetical protein
LSSGHFGSAGDRIVFRNQNRCVLMGKRGTPCD